MVVISYAPRTISTVGPRGGACPHSRVQGYLAHKKQRAPRTTVGLCLGPFGGPGGGGGSYVMSEAPL